MKHVKCMKKRLFSENNFTSTNSPLKDNRLRRCFEWLKSLIFWLRYMMIVRIGKSNTVCLIVLLIFFAHLTAADNGKILKTLESLWVWSSLRRVLKLENGIPSMIRCNASVQKALHVVFCLCDSLGHLLWSSGDWWEGKGNHSYTRFIRLPISRRIPTLKFSETKLKIIWPASIFSIFFLIVIMKNRLFCSIMFTKS